MWMNILKSGKLFKIQAKISQRKLFSHWKANVIPIQVMILQRMPNQSLFSNHDQALGQTLELETWRKKCFK